MELRVLLSLMLCVCGAGLTSSTVAAGGAAPILSFGAAPPGAVLTSSCSFELWVLSSSSWSLAVDAALPAVLRSEHSSQAGPAVTGPATDNSGLWLELDLALVVPWDQPGRVQVPVTFELSDAVGLLVYRLEGADYVLPLNDGWEQTGVESHQLDPGVWVKLDKDAAALQYDGRTVWGGVKPQAASSLGDLAWLGGAFAVRSGERVELELAVSGQDRVCLTVPDTLLPERFTWKGAPIIPTRNGETLCFDLPSADGVLACVFAAGIDYSGRAVVTARAGGMEAEQHGAIALGWFEPQRFAARDLFRPVYHTGLTLGVRLAAETGFGSGQLCSRGLQFQWHSHSEERQLGYWQWQPVGLRWIGRYTGEDGSRLTIRTDGGEDASAVWDGADSLRWEIDQQAVRLSTRVGAATVGARLPLGLSLADSRLWWNRPNLSLSLTTSGVKAAGAGQVGEAVVDWKAGFARDGDVWWQIGADQPLFWQLKWRLADGNPRLGARIGAEFVGDSGGWSLEWSGLRLSDFHLGQFALGWSRSLTEVTAIQWGACISHAGSHVQSELAAAITARLGSWCDAAIVWQQSRGWSWQMTLLWR